MGKLNECDICRYGKFPEGVYPCVECSNNSEWEANYAALEAENVKLANWIRCIYKKYKAASCVCPEDLRDLWTAIEDANEEAGIERAK